MAFHMEGATRNSMKTDGGVANQAYFQEKHQWNYEKEETKKINVWIRKIQKYYFRFTHQLCSITMILPH